MSAGQDYRSLGLPSLAAGLPSPYALTAPEIRLACARLVAEHPECFLGALIFAASELAEFVLGGKLPGENPAQGKVSEAARSAIAEAMQPKQSTAQADEPQPPVVVTTRVRFTQEEARLIHESGGSLQKAARARAAEADARAVVVVSRLHPEDPLAA